MDPHQLNRELVRLLKRKGVRRDLMLGYHDGLGQCGQRVYVKRLDLETVAGPELTFWIDAQGQGFAVKIHRLHGQHFTSSELLYQAWALDDVDRHLPAWLERLAKLRGEDCPDCHDVPFGGDQQSLQRQCTTCHGSGRVNQAAPMVSS